MKSDGDRRRRPRWGLNHFNLHRLLRRSRNCSRSRRRVCVRGQGKEDHGRLNHDRPPVRIAVGDIGHLDARGWSLSRWLSRGGSSINGSYCRDDGRRTGARTVAAPLAVEWSSATNGDSCAPATTRSSSRNWLRCCHGVTKMERLARIIQCLVEDEVAPDMVLEALPQVASTEACYKQTTANNR